MKKLYYDCAIIASYMDKYFGVKFFDWYDDELEENYRHRKDVAYEADCGWKDCDTKYAIHPDSLPIFKPKDNDNGIDSEGYNCIYSEDTGWYRDGFFGLSPLVEITRRGGLPFFVPKEEV